jgi:cytochrome c6
VRRVVLGAVLAGVLVPGFGGNGLAQTAGEATYKANCQMCHGETGAADTPAGKAMGAKSFQSPELAKMTDAAMMSSVKNGNGRMPAFKEKLTDDEIKDVITYIRELQKKTGGDTAAGGK